MQDRFCLAGHLFGWVKSGATTMGELYHDDGQRKRSGAGELGRSQSNASNKKQHQKHDKKVAVGGVLSTERNLF